MNVSMAAKQYVAAGWVLVPFDRGKNGKGPQHKGWNLRENCITTVEQASNLYGNIGIALLYSRMISIDIDNMILAIAWFAGVGIDLMAYWEAANAVRMTSGLANRGKLFFRMPAHIESLVTRMFKGEGVELRCGTAGNLTVQDVLPPSIHPLTDRPYKWLGPGDWRDIPEMPADLLAFWLTLNAPKTSTSAGVVRPIGAGSEDIEALLDKRKAETTGYDEWLRYGMGLHFETNGHSVGLDHWDAWSALDRRSVADGGYRGREFLEGKWASFHLDHENPVTLRTLAMMAGADDFAGEYEVVDDDARLATGDKVSKFKIETATEFADCEYEDDFIDDVLPDAAYGVIMGQSGSGKTFVAIDLAFAMARGVRWRDRDTKPARVLYIAAEGSIGVRKRLKAYAQHQAIDLPSINVEFLGAAPDLTANADLLALIECIKARSVAGDSASGFTHIVIDTWSQVTPGADENSSHDMGAALKRVQHLHYATGARILFVAHMGKDVTKGMRGWSGFKAAMDYELEITRAGDQRTLTVSKSRDGQDGISFGFHLHPVSIGVTRRGRPVVSCVVVHDMGQKQRRPVTPVQTAVLATIEASEGAWISFDDVLQTYKKRRGSKKSGLQPKKDQSRTAVKNALLQLAKQKWIEEKDGNYRPFTIIVDL